jgi:hypothetical protein
MLIFSYYKEANSISETEQFYDDIKPVICEDLALNGYNCKDGVLITKLSINPAITAIETLRKATASIDEVNSVVNRLLKQSI